MQALRNSVELVAFVLATSCATAVLVLAGLGVL
jgi:hypothetical protein